VQGIGIQMFVLSCQLTFATEKDRGTASLQRDAAVASVMTDPDSQLCMIVPMRRSDRILLGQSTLSRR
jgi:hypothetical protein